VPRLPYEPEGFPPYSAASLNAAAEILFSWEELCRAAVTVGRRNWADVLKFGTYSVLEALWRLAMIRANLVETPAGRLRQSDAFRALDRSEKGAVSFFLGLVLTKLVAEKLFGVPWLLHLDVYRQQLAPRFLLPERPDFVGMDAFGLWTVVESKGRCRGLPNSLLNQAKRQTQSIGSILGQVPALWLAVATDFSGGGLRARLRDPDEPEPTAVDLDLSPEHHMRAYYRPIVDLFQASGGPPTRPATPAGVLVRTPLAGMDAFLAVDDRVLGWYERGDPPLSALLAELGRRSVLPELLRLRRSLHHEEHAKIAPDGRPEDADWAARLTGVRRVGDDGVSVELGVSWGEEYMRQEPEDRAG